MHNQMHIGIMSNYVLMLMLELIINASNLGS